MYIEVNRTDVEAVKLALKSVMRQNISVKETILGSIKFLWDCYRWSKDHRYLLAALASLQAYLELGFDYEDGREMFDQLMEKLETAREIQFAGKYFPTTIIQLNKTQIKKVIGPWNSSKYHTMPIGEMLEDIMEKVGHKEEGRYEYHSNLQEGSEKLDRVFELFVGEDASYLHDVQKDKYYLFV